MLVVNIVEDGAYTDSRTDIFGSNRSANSTPARSCSWCSCVEFHAPLCVGGCRRPVAMQIIKTRREVTGQFQDSSVVGASGTKALDSRHRPN